MTVKINHIREIAQLLVSPSDHLLNHVEIFAGSLRAVSYCVRRMVLG